MRSIGKACVLALIAAGLASCGGGGGDNSGVVAPSDLHYTTPAPYTVGVAVAPLVPSYSGSAATFSVTSAQMSMTLL